jgi:hypothetical protein
LRRSFGLIPGGAQVTTTFSTQSMGAPAREVRDDARAEPGLFPLSIPLLGVTPPAVPGSRVPGLVWVGGTGAPAADAPLSGALVRQLQDIFPVLHGAGPEHDVRAGLPQRDSAWAGVLARAVLALDLEGAGNDLPLWAACFGVPTIGLVGNRWQDLLWPGLAVTDPDEPSVARLARDVLTDFVATANLVREAQAAFTRLAPAGFAEKALLLAAPAPAKYAAVLASLG